MDASPALCAPGPCHSPLAIIEEDVERSLGRWCGSRQRYAVRYPERGGRSIRPPVNAKDDVMPSISDHTIALGSLTIHYRQAGEEGLPPLIVLHGLGGKAAEWDHVCLALADRYHVFTLDQRGHGDSSWPGELLVRAHARRSGSLCRCALLPTLHLTRSLDGGHRSLPIRRKMA